VQGVVAFIAIVFVLINTLVDIGYGLIDPRVRRAPRVQRSPKATKKKEVAA
jgi:peptide/nickel transport system permease protein